MNNLEYQIFYRRHLPHFQPPGATLFITFRLAGSIPEEVLIQLREESDRLEADLRCVSDPTERKRQSEIMHSLKRYTARQANLILEREGQFWQHENYDHVIRDDGELDRIINYVIENPVKAGLVQHWRDWEWTYCKYDL